MAIHININTLHGNNKKKLQSVPFKIHADCEALINEYFDKQVKKEENCILSGSFRGHPLKGKSLELPCGYCGLILHETKLPRTDKEDRNFFIIGEFNSFISWNWDRIPSKNDKISQAFDWIDIAEVLHNSLEEE